jgi:dipeptidase E
MLRTERPIAVIANAIDGAPDDVRREGVERELLALAELGLHAEELDLREHFDAADSPSLEDKLRRHEVAWLRGGNAFTLRYALARSGADEVLPRLLAQDAIVYAGYSAGPCCLAPSLRGLELCDDADEVQQIYGEPTIWEGLGVIDEAFVPHLDTPGHPETEMLAKVADLYERTGVPHVRLRDGQVWVINGETRQLV